MKIAESSILLASSRTATEYSEHQESLTVWRPGQESVRTESQNSANHTLKQQADKFVQEAAKVSLSEAARQQRTVINATDGPRLPDEAMVDLNLRILQALFEKLTGRKCETTNVPTTQQVGQNQALAQGRGQLPEGWGLRYERHEVYHESENTSFMAKGVVLTADGQQVEIDIQLNMSRSFTARLDEVLEVGQVAFKDPLVINFGGTGAQLTQKTFRFDIDADGTFEQIAFVGPGSGFLALDRNNDGVINDGSELFGAKSGDGFADLAAYDSDRNGWIDENDPIFSQLRVWIKTASGEDRLLSLSDLGIGAIYLGRVDTAFSIKDDTNAMQGQVRATGLFLFEDGGTGTMQQLDLVA
ncbi:MAG: hypothetical protein FWG62_07890 [Proteobacteria bacterium]|nr:hypothetical protein [Pseudomonadota bacterium]